MCDDGDEDDIKDIVSIIVIKGLLLIEKCLYEVLYFNHILIQGLIFVLF